MERSASYDFLIDIVDLTGEERDRFIEQFINKNCVSKDNVIEMVARFFVEQQHVSDLVEAYLQDRLKNDGRILYAIAERAIKDGDKDLLRRILSEGDFSSEQANMLFLAHLDPETCDVFAESGKVTEEESWVLFYNKLPDQYGICPDGRYPYTSGMQYIKDKEALFYVAFRTLLEDNPYNVWLVEAYVEAGVSDDVHKLYEAVVSKNSGEVVALVSQRHSEKLWNYVRERYLWSVPLSPQMRREP